MEYGRLPPYHPCPSRSMQQAWSVVFCRQSSDYSALRGRRSEQAFRRLLSGRPAYPTAGAKLKSTISPNKRGAPFHSPMTGGKYDLRVVPAGRALFHFPAPGGRHDLCVVLAAKAQISSPYDRRQIRPLRCPGGAALLSPAASGKTAVLSAVLRKFQKSVDKFTLL